MSICISGGLHGRGGRIASLHAGNLYLDYLGGGLPPKVGMAVGEVLVYRVQ